MVNFANKKTFEEHLRQINRKKPISVNKTEFFVRKWDEKYPDITGSISIKFFYVNTFCFILIQPFEKEILAITVSCSEKASKTRKKRYLSKTSDNFKVYLLR